MSKKYKYPDVKVWCPYCGEPRMIGYQMSRKIKNEGYDGKCVECGHKHHKPYEVLPRLAGRFAHESG